jgi:hypothetical protein
MITIHLSVLKEPWHLGFRGMTLFSGGDRHSKFFQQGTITCSVRQPGCRAAFGVVRDPGDVGAVVERFGRQQ